jgi:hypothetical protein
MVIPFTTSDATYLITESFNSIAIALESYRSSVVTLWSRLGPPTSTMRDAGCESRFISMSAATIISVELKSHIESAKSQSTLIADVQKHRHISMFFRCRFVLCRQNPAASAVTTSRCAQSKNIPAFGFVSDDGLSNLLTSSTLFIEHRELMFMAMDESA